MGVATAASTFFRSIGGSFGVAIFGAIFANRLAYWLPRDDAGERAPRGHAQAGALLHASPAKIAALPPAIHTGLIDAFANSLHTVFLWAVPIGRRWPSSSRSSCARFRCAGPRRGEPFAAAVDASGEAAGSSP